MKKRKLSLLLMLVTMVTMIFTSCKKITSTIEISSEEVTKEFFNSDKVTDVDIKGIIGEIKKQNEIKNIVPEFVDKHGFIQWHESIKQKVSVESKGTNSNSNELMAILPIEKPNELTTNAFLIVMQKGDKYNFRVFNKNNLSRYGFSDTSFINAQKVQTVINYFNYEKYGTTQYKLQDIRQLGLQNLNQNPKYNNAAKITAKIKKITSNGLHQRSTVSCITLYEEQEIWWNPDGDACNCNGDEYYAYTNYIPYSFCFSEGGNGNTTWQDMLDSGTGGGQTGNGGTSFSDAIVNVSSQLNSILEPEDSYTFDFNLDQNNTLNFSTVAEFKTYIDNIKTNTTFDLTIPATIFSNDNKNETVQVIFNVFPKWGLDIDVKSEKDPNTGKWDVTNVNSSDFGLTLGWSWQHKDYSKSVTGPNEITIYVWGYINYNIFVEGIGTVYKQKKKYKIKFNTQTGSLVSITEA